MPNKIHQMRITAQRKPLTKKLQSLCKHAELTGTGWSAKGLKKATLPLALAPMQHWLPAVMQ